MTLPSPTNFQENNFSTEDFAALKTIFSCIDNTTLNGNDTHARVLQLCEDSLRMVDSVDGIGPVAAVCVYPIFVKMAHRTLAGSGIKVASVAGAFPAGQSPIAVKVQEVKYAVDQGADEIDMVLSRGTMLEGNKQQVFDEVAAIREACKTKTLKVILETGELKETSIISDASELAIRAGADFIKTSTGKITVGATLEAADAMTKVIEKYHYFSGKWVGFKAAGGISHPKAALEYYRLTQKNLGINNITNQIFRIGASRLTTRLFQLLTYQKTSN